MKAFSSFARHAAVTGGFLFLCRAAYADPPAGTTGSPVSFPRLVESKPEQSASTDSRVVAGIVLGTGLAAIAAGTTMAVAVQHHYVYNTPGGRGEPDLVGLGMLCAGVPLAMIGTVLWFNLPQRSAQVSLGPSSLVVTGRF